MPVTDEKAPKEKDFALLMRRLWKPPEGAALIFNCQMGRGRTSTGMIIASLLHLRRRVKSVVMPTEPQGELSLSLGMKQLLYCAEVRHLMVVHSRVWHRVPPPRSTQAKRIFGYPASSWRVWEHWWRLGFMLAIVGLPGETALEPLAREASRHQLEAFSS